MRGLNSRLEEHNVGQSSSEPLIRDESMSVLGEGVNLRVQETWSERTRILWNDLVQMSRHVSLAGAGEGSGHSPFPLGSANSLRQGSQDFFLLF